MDEEVEETIAKFNLRVPQDLYNRVAARAQKNKRSINNEIVVILERVCDFEEKIDLTGFNAAEPGEKYPVIGSETGVGHIVQKRVNKNVKSAENNENVN